MKAPCQKIAGEILPAVKSAISAELIRHHVSQAEASRMHSIAPSAISQYRSGKRGYRIEFSGEMKIKVAAIVQDIIDNKDPDIGERTCAICRQIRGEDEQDSMSCTCCRT